MAFLIDSTAASRLTTTPRRMPRESARPMPMMSSPPSSVISPTIAEIFDVPTSSPTRYRSFRATRIPPFYKRFVTEALLRASGSRPLVRCCDRPHIQPIVEPEVDVIDVVHSITQRRRDIEVRLQPFQEPILPEMQQRRITFDQHDGVVQIADVDL